MKTQEVKEESRQKLRHFDGGVPLSMRSKGKEYKDSSSKKEIDVGNIDKDSRRKAAFAVAKICAAATQERQTRKVRNRREHYFNCATKNWDQGTQVSESKKWNVDLKDTDGMPFY